MAGGIHPAPIIPPPVSSPFPDAGLAPPAANPLACLGGANPTPGLPPPIIMTIYNGGHWLSIVYNADGTGGRVVASDGVCLCSAVPVDQYAFADTAPDIQ